MSRWSSYNFKHMKKIIYECDNCKRPLAGSNDPSIKHIMVLRAEIRKSIADYTPIINQNCNNDGLHFCSPVCLKKYFTVIWKQKSEAKKQNPYLDKDQPYHLT